MIVIKLNLHLILVCAGLCAALAAPVSAQTAAPSKPAVEPSKAAAQPGDELVAEINAVVMPKFDRAKSSEAGYRETFTKERDAAMVKQADLIGKLIERHPENSETPALAQRRWGTMMQSADKAAAGAAETAKLATRTDKLGVDAAFFHAMLTGEATSWNADKVMPAIDAFAAKASASDDRAATLLGELMENTSDTNLKKSVVARLTKDFPDARATKSAKAKQRQLDGVGKTFEFKFADAISGKEVSNETLKGKVLVVDFWATWCGPCVADMPKMKDLYAKYKEQGVEFLGISLDQPEDKGGLTKLKEFVAKNDIGWPQYYQGNFWQSEFSSSWGINSIPAIFAVDHTGALVSTNARAKLETLIPELIAKRDGAKK